PYCGDGVCGNSEDSSSCSGDCVCDSGEIRPCSIAHDGFCAKGTESCVDGTWTGCPISRIETCDGEDNDCDGTVDDVLGGDSIEETQCGCYNNNPAQTEVCNGIDDDCDGEIDEDGNCCSNGDTRNCGPDEIGVCMKGTSTCIDNLWGPCEGAYYGEDEVCGNEQDDDCDFDVDEDCGFGFDMGMIMIIVGIIILAVIVFLYFHFRKEGKELTWKELKNKWSEPQ
ncbi:MopE-related protein, partial [Candidatus Aenigmatarchaeota archaeon]